MKLVRNKWFLLAVIAIIGLAIDVYTKNLAETKLSRGQTSSVIGQTLEFTLVYNKAAIFGLDPRKALPWFPLNGFFVVFSIVAVILLFYFYANIQSKDWLMRLGVALILPGALGNLSDRVLHMHKGVVDFIKVDLGFAPFDPWPIFNMADSYVSVGVTIIMLCFIRDEFFGKKKQSTRQEPATPAQSLSNENSG
ncbi:MAG: signal peptidase II [Chitinivibrionales bacterium]|nr:signal peptidase II [Chitinivibrionales bacterium]